LPPFIFVCIYFAIKYANSLHIGNIFCILLYVLYAKQIKKYAYDQEVGYLSRNRKKGTYSEEKYLDKQNEFGLIVFESNKDLDSLGV